MIKNPEEITKAAKYMIDALMRLCAYLVGGFTEISLRMIALTQNSFETNFVLGMELFSIKTQSDWTELHPKSNADPMRTAIVRMIEFSTLSAKVPHQTCEPLTTHFNTVFSKK